MSEGPRDIAVAIDIGGTFTDVVAWTPGGLVATKVPSRRGDPVAAVREGVAAILGLAGAEPGAVGRFVHGTTVATNAVLTMTGARVGLLATAGFEDVLEIGRQKRSRMYDLFMPPETPVFLAPKRRRIGIGGRIAADGRVLEPLDEAGVRAAIRHLVEVEGIEALAVAYLFSFRSPCHERRTREIAAEVAPGLPVSLSCEVDPTFREYERTCVAAFDAYVRPVMTRYLARLEGGLRAAGVAAPVEMMQSRGAIAGAEQIVARPVASLLSGPAAGALGARVVGERAGFPDVIGLDMGGTSTDVAVIRGGRLVATRESRISGFPLRVQMVDVHTIGAGGGSIARLDEGGALKVGPQSAEAEPGPACYGRGGTAATVTDASLVLGLLDASSFAGSIAIDPVRARAAVGPIAAAMGGTPERAAHGILTVSVEAMAEAIRMVTVRRGVDPRGFAIVALGGAGPVHAVEVARRLGIRTVLVPPRPGVLAAEGLLHAGVEHAAQRTVAMPMDAAGALPAAMRMLAAEAAAVLEPGRPADAPLCIAHAADMRYAGQSYEIEVPLADPDDPALGARAVDAFHAAYRAAYGHDAMGGAIEIVNLRAVARYRRAVPAEDALPCAAAAPVPAGARPVVFDPAGPAVATPVFRRADLGAGAAIEGPAIVAQDDTTTVVPPGCRARVHVTGTLIIEEAAP